LSKGKTLVEGPGVIQRVSGLDENARAADSLGSRIGIRTAEDGARTKQEHITVGTDLCHAPEIAEWFTFARALQQPHQDGCDPMGFAAVLTCERARKAGLEVSQFSVAQTMVPQGHPME
jgi:hypothetical protein